MQLAELKFGLPLEMVCLISFLFECEQVPTSAHLLVRYMNSLCLQLYLSWIYTYAKVKLTQFNTYFNNGWSADE